MTYDKHNFLSGQILHASDLNEMEDGIVANETAIGELGSAVTEMGTALTGKADSADVAAALEGKAEASDVESIEESMWDSINVRFNDYGILSSTEIGSLPQMGTTQNWKHLLVPLNKTKALKAKVWARKTVSDYIWVLGADFKVVRKVQVSNNYNTDVLVDVVLTRGSNEKYAVLLSHIENEQANESVSLKILRDKNSNGEEPTAFFQNIAIVGASWVSGYFYTDSTHNQEDNAYSPIAFYARKNGINPIVLARKSTDTHRWLDEDAAYGIDKLESSSAANLYLLTLLGNDSSKGSAYLGTIEDIEDTSADTFYANYGKIIRAIKLKSENATIVMVAWMINQLGDRLDYMLAMRNIADYYSVPFILMDDYSDFFSFELSNSTKLIGNHPTQAQLAKMGDEFGRVIVSNKEVSDSLNSKYFAWT